MKKQDTRLFLLSGLIAVLDQLTKGWIQNSFDLWETKSIIPGFFNLVFYYNKGAAFGFLNREDIHWQPYFFIVASVLAIVLIFYLSHSEDYQGRLAHLGLGFILGGAIGNMIDRIRFGYVIDFLDFFIKGQHWPAFNVADVAISSGVVCLLVSFYQRKRHASRSH